MYTEKKVVIVSCVCDYSSYSRLCKSVRATKNVQLYPIDNTSSEYSIPSAYNSALKRVEADLFVFVHQDVIFPENWLEHLDDQIQQVEMMNKDWGVLGVMGVRKCGRFAGHIIDPHTNHKIGRLPCPVVSLDEVCLIIRKSSGLSFDKALGGYHLYGADLCLQAGQEGLKCYAIDACLTHLSGGKIDDSYCYMLNKFQKKWGTRDRCPYIIETTCGVHRLKKGSLSVIYFYYAKWRRKLISRLQKRHIPPDMQRCKSPESCPSQQ